MKIYLDQMFRADLAELLIAQGHDVIRAEQVQQDRADDAEILDSARAQGRILITLDEHFGDWTVLPLSRHPGVIRIKVHRTFTKDIAAVLLPFLANQAEDDFRNHLVILSAQKVRWIKTASD